MNTTLITGASSGIGEAFARKLAARGHNLLLVARSEDKLITLCNELGRDLLINNAGFGSMGDFANLDLAHELKMVDLNVRALVELTHRFLAPMRERKKGGLINVASTAGFQPVPFMATYAATKAFVLSFTEALWEENRPHGVKVMALCPGVTDTNFFAASKMQRPPARTSQTPEQVVDVAMRALARGKSSVISGWTNFFMVETQRAVPRTLVLRAAGAVLRSHTEGGK
jgi:short-subunit dehydrogenase